MLTKNANLSEAKTVKKSACDIDARTNEEGSGRNANKEGNELPVKKNNWKWLARSWRECKYLKN